MKINWIHGWLVQTMLDVINDLLVLPSHKISVKIAQTPTNNNNVVPNLPPPPPKIKGNR